MEYNHCDVAITKCLFKNESRAVINGLKKINAGNLINKDDVVLIVPNWVNDKKINPKDGVVVGPDTLKAIIKWVKKHNPKKIIVGSGSGNGDTLSVMEKVGYDQVLKEEDIKFIDFNSGPYITLELNHDYPKQIKINKVFEEMTKLISFTQLKIHEEATISSSIKNIAMSFPSTEEHGIPKKNKGIHNDLHGFIRAMAEKITIDISIVSLNPVMVATGPTNGISKHTGLVVVGNNPISVDTVCARLLGYRPQAIRYLYELEQRKIKETDINKINMLGMSFGKAEKIVTKKIYGEVTSFEQ